MSNPDNIRVQTLDIIRERIKQLRGTGMTWRDISKEFDGVPAGTLCAIYKYGREPKKAEIRKKLGLPELAEVEKFQDENGNTWMKLR